MRFIALIETNKIYNYLILKHFKEKHSNSHYFLDNIALAKAELKCYIQGSALLFR